MKIGVRKPNLKKRIKARTTAKVKRAVKRSVNPLYGKKGMGYINDPKKAVYNKIYNKTTISADDIVLDRGKGKGVLLWFLMILFWPITLIYFILKALIKR